MVGPLISLSLIFAAISRSPWFSWTGNYLSDLGANQDVAGLFNTGLIAGGAVTMIFTIGLKGTLPGLTRGGVGVIALFLGESALCCVGIFPETVGRVHFESAGLFFILVIIGLVLVGSALMQKPSERNLGLFIFTTGLSLFPIFVALAVIKEFSQVGGAIPEFLVSLGASVCFIILGIRLFKRWSSQDFRKRLD